MRFPTPNRSAEQLGRRRFLALAAGLPCGAPAVTASPPPEVASRSAPGDRAPSAETITIFLCGDVMTGRGIDHVLPDPSDPTLYEPSIRSAADYVALAERAHGPIPKPVDLAYVWGDALPELKRWRPDVRIVNLETAVTRRGQPVAKGINYRMSPGNARCLTVPGIDVCTLANNHVLDWGRLGLLDSLDTLHGLGLTTVGAGRDDAGAEAPAIVDVPGKGRVVVLAYGVQDSGIPAGWAAGPDRAGVAWLANLSDQGIERIAARVERVRRPGDVVILSLHWGGNWGHGISAEQIRFAHALVERAGADVVHGHSSHHPKAIEIHAGRPILYGCGDFLNDYEGIGGYEAYRDDLTLMYFLRLRPSDGRLVDLTMVPLQIRHFRLNRPAPSDATWLLDVMNREGARFGTRFARHEDGAFTLADRPAS